MTGEPTRFSRWGNRISWLLVPLAAVMQFVWLRRPVNIAGVTMTLELPLFGFLALIAAPWAVARIRVMTRWVQVLAGVFTVLIVYAMVGIAWRASPVVETSHLTVVPSSYLLVPLLTALLAMAAGLGLAMAADRRHLPVVLTWAAGALVAAGFVAWPRQVPAHRSLRLATALGGSASIHLVFLLAVAVGLGWYLRSRGTVRSVEGAAGPAWPGLVLVVLGVTGVLATGSRGGLLALVAWVVLLAVQLLFGRNGRQRRLWPWLVTAGAGIGVAVVVAALFPSLGRLFSLGDPLREQNLFSALTWWTRDWQTIVAGAGSGQVWPWFAIDSGLVPAPGERMVPTPAGQVLLSPHSTLLAVVVELGLVGALLAGVMVFALCKLALRGREDAFAAPLALALLATLVAFLFDTYLFKEFGNAFWWWLAAGAVAVCCSPVERQALSNSTTSPR